MPDEFDAEMHLVGLLESVRAVLAVVAETNMRLHKSGLLADDELDDHLRRLDATLGRIDSTLQAQLAGLSPVARKRFWQDVQASEPPPS